ncbi:hypothetical protein AGMMS49579_06020 [Spirochaetia bacterium]|nr:hypothetical protein AGMMS49579_06020 [Spirochaetia bacterium]
MHRITVFVLCVFLSVSPVFAQQSTAFADKPAVLTSVGQSADFEMVRVLLTRARFDFRTDPLIGAAGLGTADKTLILVVGGSSKGLGAAGISAETELERTNALIKKAREMGLKIIALHVGGEGRRGTLSDVFVRAAVPASDYVIVVGDGDKDGLIAGLARSAGIVLQKVDKISAVSAPLIAAFK